MVARHDLATDPELLDALLTVRRGTAFFGRKLNELPDSELNAPSLLDGWSKAHVIAHVGYNARALCRLLEWANTGVENPMYSSPVERNREIEFGATLNPTALRNLYEHSAIHLNVEWRDTPDEAWTQQVKTAQGRTVAASETIWMRTREIWIHAVDLDNGAGFEQIPENVLDRLLADITGMWKTRGQGSGILLRDIDTGTLYGEAEGAQEISGRLPDLAAWASGRPSSGLSANYGTVEPAPRWL
ncbi:maleylpyruvate isomerase family mycothiol-dependent enzyme [Glutamicibacter nicotianae]|uniref:maleylpyruvate isomerase family mycothiol-dependent enzyme n=1 Tax=Glutamicibacter nicotianae TaxID=37929 RepID=UPI000EF87D86|nr:maleylpyruvate isomerase family mycothiol-dependent enzyme [Glutamicibacter nicotianae]